MNNCTNCSAETLNPRFCSRSCSTTYNNRMNPKRKRQHKCKMCDNLRRVDRAYCSDECKLMGVETRSIERWESETLATMKGEGNANAGSRYPYIRTLARKKYLRSGRKLACVECGYDTYVEVCHIQDVRSFPESATVAEVNSLDNLVALCRNHHWEFDNGLLSVNGVLK